LDERAGDALDWIERAEQDLVVAGDLFRLGHFEAAAFHAQQAAEKALKSVQIRTTGTFDRTHDLIKLARSLKAGRDVEGHAAILAPFYTAARYPDVGGGVVEEEVMDALRRAQEVVQWARTR
jgi:HEPN domain-containing protein